MTIYGDILGPSTSGDALIQANGGNGGVTGSTGGPGGGGAGEKRPEPRWARRGAGVGQGVGTRPPARRNDARARPGRALGDYGCPLSGPYSAVPAKGARPQ